MYKRRVAFVVTMHVYLAVWNVEIGEQVHLVCSSPVMNVIDMLLL